MPPISAMPRIHSPASPNSGTLNVAMVPPPLATASSMTFTASAPILYCSASAWTMRSPSGVSLVMMRSPPLVFFLD